MAGPASVGAFDFGRHWGTLTPAGPGVCPGEPAGAACQFSALYWTSIRWVAKTCIESKLA